MAVFSYSRGIRYLHIVHLWPPPCHLSVSSPLGTPKRCTYQIIISPLFIPQPPFFPAPQTRWHEVQGGSEPHASLLCLVYFTSSHVLRVQPVSEFPSVLRLTVLPGYSQSPLWFSIHLLMDTWVSSIFWLLQSMLV